MIYGLTAAMSKPFHKTEGPVALDPSTDRSICMAGHRRDFVFIINPKGANGHTGREWKKLRPYLMSRLRAHNIREVLTSGPSHAVDLTRKAIREGADAVIAVGGDGTLHEVVNGFFFEGKPVSDFGATHTTTFGLIPLGTGSDFARSFGWRNDPYDAVDRIFKGMTCDVDVGIICEEHREPHYFINVADIHLSAEAGYYASQHKRFGKYCYVIGALRAFMQHSNKDLRIKVDGGEWQIFHKVTAICIGNAQYFGGGMKISPTSDPCDGKMEVVILQNFRWYDFILKLHKLYGGTHILEKNVKLLRAQVLEVDEIAPSNGVLVQADGEHLGLLPKKFYIMHGALSLLI